MKKILITGGSGLIGRQLRQLLLLKGYEVVTLSRKPEKDYEYLWDISKKHIDTNAFENTTHIVHLAGAGIADKRWTTRRKKEIIDSRIDSANLLFDYVQKLSLKLEGFIAASGIGYYGAITSEIIYDETSAPLNDFISKVCISWENASNRFTELDIPVTIFRTGVVLSKDGGALAKMNTPLFLSTLGNGKQFLPWIHTEDLCSLYALAIETNQLTGIFNAVAPEHITNSSFTKELGKALNKPLTPFGIPPFLLKIILGELSSVLLKGSRISSKKISSFYAFSFPTLKEALQDICKK